VSTGILLEDDGFVKSVLAPIFGKISTEQWAVLKNLIEWVHIDGGEQVIKKGAPSDSIYFLLQGRLTVLTQDEDGKPVKIGEVIKGQSVGELGFFSDKPRSADVYANRDSTLIRFDREAMEQTSKLFPDLMIHVMNTVIRRASNQLSSEAPMMDESRNIAILYEGKNGFAESFIEKFAEVLSRQGKCTVINKVIIDDLADQQNLYHLKEGSTKEIRRQKLLEQFELENEFLLLCAADEDDIWLHQAIRQSDVLCILKSQGDGFELNHVEDIIFNQSEFNKLKEKHLIMLHPNGDSRPKGTHEMLKKRPVKMHHHVRMDRLGDIERIVRFLTNKAIGIAFAGGGAKGLAHIGVILSFRKKHIPIDFFAGTSVGAIGSAIGAMDLDDAGTVDICKRLAEDAPTRSRNMNLIPFISLMKGKDLDSYTSKYFGGLMIEDLWINFGCVASNLTTKSKVEITSGRLDQAIRSSIALPGIFTPFVSNNDLWVDGGVIDNLPIDLLTKNNVGKKVIVTLDAQRSYELGYEQVPDSWEYFFQKIRGIKYPIPKLSTIIMESMILASYSKYGDAIKTADLHLKPPVSKIGLLQWGKHKKVVEIGKKYTEDMLEEEVIQKLLDIR